MPPALDGPSAGPEASMTRRPPRRGGLARWRRCRGARSNRCRWEAEASIQSPRIPSNRLPRRGVKSTDALDRTAGNEGSMARCLSPRARARQSPGAGLPEVAAPWTRPNHICSRCRGDRMRVAGRHRTDTRLARAIAAPCGPLPSPPSTTRVAPFGEGKLRRPGCTVLTRHERAGVPSR
jgi:hypothetical protein